MEMKIYDETKTILLNESQCDLEIGYFDEETLITHHPAVVGQEEEGHWVTVQEYPNGGKDVEWVIDKPGIQATEAYDEEERVKIYYVYSDTQIKIREIENQVKEKDEEIAYVKKQLADSDYVVLKYMEGAISKKDFKLKKDLREKWRKEVNQLEDERLKLNLEREKLEKENEWYCPKCTKLTNAYKKLDLFYLPKYLTICLKRFKQNSIAKNKIQIIKNTETVQFDSDKINMEPFILGPKIPKPIYELYSVCQHSGSIEGGRYISACKNLGKWFMFDDASVFPCDEDMICTPEGYILFYKKAKEKISSDIGNSMKKSE